MKTTTVKRKPYTIHKTDVIINKQKLKNILDSKDMEYVELQGIMHDKYGIDLKYKGFMSLLDNHSTWKLVYAWIICEILDIKMTDIFEQVEVDIEKKKKEKEIWKERYDNKAKKRG